MNDIDSFYNHHAILFRVENLIDFKLPEEFLKDDVLILEYDQFKISQVREVISLSNQRPVRGSFRVLVIKFSYIFHEAQNALLKTLEEPPTSTKFIVVTLKDTELLPTVLSRLQIAEGVTTAEVKKTLGRESVDDFIEFIDVTYKQRLAIIEAKIKKKDYDWIKGIKIGLWRYLNKLDYDNLEINTQARLRLVRTSQFLLNKGVNNKMLLEYLALYLPGKK